MNSNTRIRQIFLFSLIIMFFVAGFFNFLVNNNLVVRAWGGVVSSTPVGAGTEESPYLISTAEELFWLSTETNEGNFFRWRVF